MTPTASTALDLDGETTSDTDARGYTTTYQYDDLGRKIKTFDALNGNSITNPTNGNLVEQTVYDLDGRTLSSTDAKNNITSYTYDNDGNLLKTTYPDGTTSQSFYDQLNRRYKSIDQDGLVTFDNYDQLGRLQSVETPLSYESLNGNPNHVTPYYSEQYTYDELGEKLTQTDANGHTTSFAYDIKGHLIAKKLPAGQTMYQAYNADGTLASETDYNGHEVDMHYDTAGRLVSKSDSTGTLYSAVYNPDGTLQSKTKYSPHGNVITSYTYDSQGRIHSVTTANTNGNTTSVSYTYDVAGNKSSQNTWLGLADTGTPTGTLNYSYDADERLSQVSDANNNLVASYDYDLNGNRWHKTLANGITTTYSYDSLNRLTDLTNAKGSTIVSEYTYTLKNSGKRSIVKEYGSGGTLFDVVNYTYDDDGRLTNESSSQVGNVTYTYDNVGNRLFKTAGNNSPAQAFIYDADDRVLTINGASNVYQYDANGNVLSDGSHTYTWDWENKLTDFDLNTTNHISYTYDSDGLRIQQAIFSGVTNYTTAPTSATMNGAT